MMCTSKFFGTFFSISRRKLVCGAQCGKQRGGSVAPIIVGHCFDITQSQWQHRLGAFQCWNSALLIYAQNHSVLRGIQIQPYNIPYFFSKKWIVRKLEMILSMRLQAKRRRNALGYPSDCRRDGSIEIDRTPNLAAKTRRLVLQRHTSNYLDLRSVINRMMSPSSRHS